MFAYLDTSSDDRVLKFGTGYNPTPKDNEIKIRVTACGLCRTGISNFQIILQIQSFVESNSV